MRTVVVGGTRGLGLEVARARAARGDEVVLTGRDGGHARTVASSVEGSVTGLALDLDPVEGIAEALAGVETVDRLVIAAIDRDANTARDYDVTLASHLAVIKLVGYTEVVHTLLPRMGEDAAIVLFGGRAKDRPYPGSITVSSVNGAVTGMVRALAQELAPIRVNALHPGIIGDSPFWEDKPPAVIEGHRAATLSGRLATMQDVVGAVDFLLGNHGVNATNLYLDGGLIA